MQSSVRATTLQTRVRRVRAKNFAQTHDSNYTERLPLYAAFPHVFVYTVVLETNHRASLCFTQSHTSLSQTRKTLVSRRQ